MKSVLLSRKVKRTSADGEGDKTAVKFLANLKDEID